jgi:UDP-N-acetylmuramoyl-L-alanyl-D-glutamate--2,6-diaminopimelate ligase
MKLSKLLAGVPVTKLFQTMYGRMVVTQDVEINRIQYDSRRIMDNDCFVAIRGVHGDGHSFIQDAINRGAKVVVMQDDARVSDSFFMHAGVVKVVVPDSRKALAQMASNFFDLPSTKLEIVGITGTNGKTTTSTLVYHILQAAGREPGLIGTIEYRIGSEVRPAVHTTPESLELNEMLATMVQRNCRSVSMEVSSHALHQSRVFGVNFHAAVFTNLTQDHLDYHGTMEEYFKAKKILFDGLKSTATAIFNADDPYGKRIVERTSARKLSYGIHKADVQAENIRLSLDGSSFEVRYDDRTEKISSALVGRFNVHNILAGYATGLALGIPPEVIQEGIGRVQNVRGRFERIASPRGWTAIIDYAHTPDALEKCLRTIHDVLPTPRRGKIITVFGAGGDRDRAKRPIMGRIANTLSDLTIVTSDNPRTEDPEAIVDQIVQGMEDHERVVRQVDRRRAIEHALSIAGPNDAILIAGKGHEKFPFSDRQIVEEFLRTQS